MKSPQARINSRAQRRDIKNDMKQDAIELATFLAKGAGVLIATAFLFFLFDEVVDLSERTAGQILSPFTGDR